MALPNATFLSKSPSSSITNHHVFLKFHHSPPPCRFASPAKLTFKTSQLTTVAALDHKSTTSSGGGGGGGDGKKSSAVPNSNYVVPLDKAASCITRPLAEILRDLNKRIPDNILKPNSKIIPWYHANRMLSFYAPGWCGEVRDVIFADEGSVTVVYRVTIRGSDGEAYREATGTISSNEEIADPVAAAEEIAFVRACARFGLGLYLYHED